MIPHSLRQKHIAIISDNPIVFDAIRDKKEEVKPKRGGRGRRKKEEIEMEAALKEASDVSAEGLTLAVAAILHQATPGGVVILPERMEQLKKSVSLMQLKYGKYLIAWGAEIAFGSCILMIYIDTYNIRRKEREQTLEQNSGDSGTKG